MSSAHRQLLKDRARLLRHRPTHSEELLWSVLRGRQLGVTFRRQVVIGRFIVDFAAPEARLVVEVDGGYHEERSAADARRDAELARRGYRVVRFSAVLVERDVARAVGLVRMALVLGCCNALLTESGL